MKTRAQHRPQHNLDTNGFYVILFSVFCLVSLAGSGKVSMTDVVRAKFGSGSDDIGIITPEEAKMEIYAYWIR